MKFRHFGGSRSRGRHFQETYFANVTTPVVARAHQNRSSLLSSPRSHRFSNEYQVIDTTLVVCVRARNHREVTL